MWLKKLKRKKLQFFMVGLVLFATTMIFAMCLCFTAELSTFSKKCLTQENSPDVFIVSTKSRELKDNITNQAVKDNIESVTTLGGKAVSVPITYDGSNIALYWNMMLSSDDYRDWNCMEVSEGDTGAMTPKEGEVWIAKKMADPNGIKIGDTIVLEYSKPLKLKVTGFYTAKFAPAATMTYAPLVVSKQDLSKVENEPDAALFAVNLHNESSIAVDSLTENYPYCECSFTREGLQKQVTNIASIIGGMGALAAMVIFVIALIIIRFIIKSNLLKEYRSIGIYKSLGYSSKKIRSFYLKGYLLVGIIAILAGTLAALPFAYELGIMCTEYIAGFKLTFTSARICMIVIVLLMGLLCLNVLMSLRRVKKITPVEAITVGITSTEKKLTRSIIKNAKSPISIAINEIFKYKKSSVMVLLVLTFCIYLSMLFTMGAYSSYMMSENSNQWFNVPKCNTYVMGDVNDDVVDWINNSNYVDSMVYGNISYSVDLRFPQYNGKINNVSVNIFNDVSYEKTKIPTTKGNLPKRADEIAAQNKLLETLGKQVGDYIKLEINGVLKEYLISGSYNSMLDENGIILTREAMKQSVPEYKSAMCFVKLKDKSEFEAFKHDMQNQFSGISIDQNWKAMDNVTSSIKGMLISVCDILIVIFILFAILNIVIVLLMENESKHRQHGILKALGFTNGYIMKKNLCKFIILSVISTGAALAMHLLVSKKLMEAMVINAFSDSYPLLFGLVSGILGLIVLATVIINLSLRKISPVELMEE